MNKRINRRQFLIFSALSSSAACGLCAVSGLASFLIARHIQQHIQPPTPTPFPTVPPTPTLAPPPIVSREGWGARPINHEAEQEKGFASPDNPLGWYLYQGDLATIYKTVAIHHSYPIRRDTGTMRDIQNLHLDGQKWADIGYHFGVDGKGIIYAGRDIHVRGSSVAGHNTGTIGVVAIGDFEQETPSDPQMASLQTLIIWLKATYHVTHLAGHYEFNSETVCPGANMRPRLDGLAQNVALLRGTGGYNGPTPLPTTPTPAGCC